MMPTTLTDLLQRSATLFPNNCAYRFGEQEISYQELFQQATSLGSYLTESGVKTGDRVGILLTKNIDTVIAVYGVLYAGAAYVPIDNTAPEKRISTIIKQCHIAVTITNVRLSHRINVADVQSIITDQGYKWLSILQGDTCNKVTVTEHDIAYIMFTSGSTGTPKGIVHTHSSAMAFAAMMSQRYELQPDDRITGLSPLHFDMSTFDIFAANYVGACTVLFSEAHQKIAASLTQLAERESVTIWYSTPFSLIQSLDYGALEQRNLSSLRWIIYAGEAFPLQQLKRLMNALANARFSNAYGPAEINVCHTFEIPCKITKDDELYSEIPIGTVCTDVMTKIINDDGNKSNHGELWVSSPTMMQGYWNAPELTQQTIVRDKQGDRYYKTGDLVKITHDGLFYFLGRKDRQVKLRGFRIELEEVEEAISSIPGVKISNASIIKNELNINAIYADVLLEADACISVEIIMRSLTAILPAYAIPQEISVISEFPLTSSGKIDRRKLAQLWHDNKKAE